MKWNEVFWEEKSLINGALIAMRAVQAEDGTTVSFGGILPERRIIVNYNSSVANLRISCLFSDYNQKSGKIELFLDQALETASKRTTVNINFNAEKKEKIRVNLEKIIKRWPFVIGISDTEVKEIKFR